MNKGPIIKRKGSIIPTICLIVLVLICTVIVWLSTAGLPRFIVDKIEAAIAAKGVPIKIEKVKLDIFLRTGIEADGIKVYARPEDEHPIVTVDTVKATFSPLKLLTGEVEIKTLQLENGIIDIPVSDVTGQHNLTTHDINISATFHKGHMRLTASDLKLEGIPIHVKGTFDLSELLSGDTADEEHEKLVIPAIIKTCQSVIDRVYHQLEHQHWQPNEFPEIYLDIKAAEDIKIHVQARAPKYDIDTFHFRDAIADINYEGDQLLINNLEFKTVEPASHVQLKGGYELETRKLNVTLESDAALLDMGKALTQDEGIEWLNKFSHKPEHAPHVKLRINATFGQNLTLNSATIDGEIDQKKLRMGDTIIDQLHLSFFYNNGDFNINKLTLRFPDGKIHFRASSENGRGSAELQADLPIVRTITLINEFTDSPVFIPAGLKCGNSISFSAKANLSMPEFKAGDTYQNQFIPSITSIQAQVNFENLQFMGYSFTEPSLSFSIVKGAAEGGSLRTSAEIAQLQLTAKEFAYNINNSPLLTLSKPEAKLDLKDIVIAEDSDNIKVADAQFHFQANALDYDGMKFNELNIYAEADKIKYSEKDKRISQAKASLTLNSLSKENIEISDISIASHITLKESGDILETLSSAQLNIVAENISYDGKKLGKFSSVLDISENREGELTARFIPETESLSEAAELTATTCITKDGYIHIQNLKAYFPCSNLEHVTKAFGIQFKDIEMPHHITLTGSASLHSDTLMPSNFQVDVKIPEIVRLPHRIQSFKGKRITVATEVELQAKQTEEGQYAYNGKLKVNHQSGKLDATFSGDTARQLHVTGFNTIRPDIVDMLLDYDDAHEILRDFNFDNNSQAIIDNIVVDVQYDNGTCVKVDCDLTLKNARYQLEAIVVDEKGTETPNKALGKLPFTNIDYAKTHLTANHREGVCAADGTMEPTVSVIEMRNVQLVYNNRAWLKQQDFSTLGVKVPNKKYQTSTLRGDKVVIDIENGAVKLVNVKGTVYAAYALGMFYPDLRDHLSIVLTPYPTTISTAHCQFPIYSDSKEKMEGNISVSCNEVVGLDLLGTQIPLTKFTGFVNLEDDYIFLDRINARCWDGTVNAAVKIGITNNTLAFDGQVTAKNMNLQKIAKSYNTKLDTALCEATIRFRSKTSEIRDIQAYGNMRIVNGNLMSLSIFRPIGAFVSDVTGNIKELDESARKHETKNVLQRLSSSTGATINAIGTQLDKTAQYLPGYNHVFAYDLQDAFVDFTISDGHFKTTRFKALGYNLKVTGLLDINIETTEIYGNMWPEVSSLPTIVISPITFLSDFMLDIVLHGKIDDIQWSFQLDKRISNDSPKTADTAKDKECAKKTR